MIDDFTAISSVWLNKFLNDLAKDKKSVLKAVEDFPGDQEIVKQGILNGPEIFQKTDVAAAKSLFNFIEFYSTGKISSIDVRVAKNEREI